MVRLRLSIFLLVLMLAGRAICLRKFCSVMCSTTSCSDNTVNGCNNRCSSNWVAINGGNNCIPNANNNYFIADKTDDLGGTLVVSPGSPTSSPCASFTTYGPYTTDHVTVSFPGVSGTTPFFQLIVYFGIISMDAQSKWGGGSYWDSNTLYYVDMTDGSFSQSNSYKLYGSTKVQSQKYCYSGWRSEYWNRFMITYAYNTTATPLTWTIYNDETTNTSALWALKEFVVVYRGCHSACTSCYGPAATQCWTCLSNGTVTMWQSNNTCNQSCITGFGYESVPNICVFCDLHCTACYDVWNNCSACTTYGTYQAFLYSINSSCLSSCPVGYFANKTTHTCDLCNVNCTACIYTADYCTECIPYFGYAGHVCYSPCPIGYYNNTNGTNCTACSKYCYICVDPADLCTVCTTVAPYTAYLYNATNATGDCVRVCPTSWYPQTFSGAGPNLCLACNYTCYICSGNPTPCSQCIADYYLYSSSCMNPCPDGYFESNYTGTGTCLQCSVWCVDLTIDMYFPTSLNKQIYIDMQFSQEVNFTTLTDQTFQNISITSDNMKYDESMFNYYYQILGKAAYRIIIEPKGYIFLYNATFTVTTIQQPNSTTHYSTTLMPFKTTNYNKSASLSWFLIKGPPFSTLEENIMQSFSRLSTKTNDFLAQPYVQEIKKSGLFNLLFSGAQITSCSVLSNQIQSQNLYEGVRFWAIFVFFDVPPYEAISNQTKYFVVPSVENQIRNAQETSNSRSLFSTDSMYWRFQRTGQTSFFIYDCYIPICLLVVCWILLAVACNCTHKQWYPRHAGKIFSAVHKVHQISLLYVTMAAVVEFIYFQPTSTQRIVSAIVCAVFNVYFVVYELYIYYDMLKYPLARIGNRLYDYYIIRYGTFLKNIRYEEYDINEQWSPKHWFRPYNFHFLSYYKKFLMIITLPLFYETFYAQMSILLFLQVTELIRVWVVWPFVSKKRNWLRFSLELALTLFFLSNIIQIALVQELQNGDINQMGTVISLFYGMGWAGFVFCFYFNLTFVAIGIYDFCVGMRTSNREKMDQARKKYYYHKIKQYEKDNEAASKELVGRWVKLGNLNNNFFGQLPEVNIRIEEYTMNNILGRFEVEVRKISELRMLERRSHKKKNNTVTKRKYQKKGILAQHVCPELYSSLHGVYQQFASNHIEKVVLKTFLNVFQPDFAEGEDIPMNRLHMFQRVELISFDNEREERQLDEMMEGFPLPLHYFERF